MANIKSAKKRIQITKRQSEENLAHRTKAKTFVKKANVALLSKEPDQIALSVKEATKVLDTVARKGVIHPNKAARLKSRLAKKVNALTASV
ncbi:MAG: 30S ribosomal protein S20 [Candidatus Margulisiibacteriota bacterium]